MGTAAALVGLVGSCCCKGCCMSAYLVLAILITLAELGITLAMFFAETTVVNNLATSEAGGGTPTQDQ